MKRFTVLIAVVLLVLAAAVPASAGASARKPAINDAAARVVDLQRADTAWEGTWFWTVGSTYNATNLTGVTALGLLEAYRDSKDPAYLASAVEAAGFITAHLGSAATSTQYYPRATAADIVFLFALADVTGDATYATVATSRWGDITAKYPTAASLDAVFHTLHRRLSWDFGFFLEAASAAGDTVWADDMAAIIADTSDTFYYGSDNVWLALNLAAGVRSLVNTGYGETYYGSVTSMLSDLIGMIGADGSIGGWVQDTAYAVLAFSSVGGAAHSYANDLGRWLATHQTADGGWLEAGDEYPEIDGEALRALASTIGTNYTLDGFAPGKAGSSSWKHTAVSSASAFSG